MQNTTTNTAAKTFYFATGVNTNIYPNSPAFIPFECENVPDGSTFKFACDNPNLYPDSGYFVAPIVGGGLLSKYAYFTN